MFGIGLYVMSVYIFTFSMSFMMRWLFYAKSLYVCESKDLNMQLQSNIFGDVPCVQRIVIVVLMYKGNVS
ncbi:hypothetical protein AOT81_04830 [Xylella fastidiosa]|nr:hypothetical protein AOT81_04830 [Xylella fastidiosa]RWA44958.1 hypothetical protein XfCFBP8356_02840 [Xylella fastidiosa subsp. sandyi]